MNVQEIIGIQQTNDWLLDPKSHADSLPDEANSLKRILNGSRVQVLQKRYERHNTKAMAAQKTYLNQSKRRIYSATGSIIFAALILYIQSGVLVDDGELLFKGEIIWLLGIIELIFLAVTTYTVFILRNSSSYEDWMDERAHAETIRVKYFTLVSKNTGANDPILNELQLEYFRRYMLDVQLNYYDGRGEQHKNHAKKFMTRTGILTTLAAIVAAIPASLHIESVTQVITLFAFIGAILAALIAMQSMLSMLSEDQRNSRRYESVYYQLLDLSGELDTVRAAAKRGEHKITDEFIAQTNEVIALENQEWQTRRERKPKVES